MPRERIAKHLSERAPTAGSIHVNIHSHFLYKTAPRRVIIHPTFVFCVLFQENVLNYPKSSVYAVLFRENVLDGTKSWPLR